jgi:1-acyl-sn-glycerol-3-phosphate acyltransferase
MIGLGLPRDVRAAIDAAGRRLRGDYEEDEWGYDAEFARLVQPVLDFAYDRWWRVTTVGVGNVPPVGRALIVANHAGVLPWEAAMMATALRRGLPAPARRDPRFLVLDGAFELPWISIAVRRYGGVPASPYNALRLLEADHAVMAFPEGARAADRPRSERYRLERFGRGGFVELALRTRSPIVPCAVVGSQEIYPRLPFVGSVGLVPLPSRWRIAFGEPIVLDHPPEAADDRALVLECSDAVRDRIQEMVYENLIQRVGAFV